MIDCGTESIGRIFSSPNQTQIPVLARLKAGLTVLLAQPPKADGFLARRRVNRARSLPSPTSSPTTNWRNYVSPARRLLTERSNRPNKLE